MSTQTANDFDLALEEYSRSQQHALRAEGWLKGAQAKFNAGLIDLATLNDSAAHLTHCLARLDGFSRRLKKATQQHTASIRAAAKRHVRTALPTTAKGG